MCALCEHPTAAHCACSSHFCRVQGCALQLANTVASPCRPIVLRSVVLVSLQSPWSMELALHLWRVQSGPAQVSISKISRSSSRSFKCPYCPSEASQSSCRQIHFPDIRT